MTGTKHPLVVTRGNVLLGCYKSNPISEYVCVFQVVLEKVCGEDHVCISDLNVSLSFMRLVYTSLLL